MTLAPLMGHLTTVLVALPPGDSDPSSGQGPEWGKAAPIGLLIWLLMGLALFFLIKSMNRNLKKVPESFESDEPAAPGSTGQPEVAGSVEPVTDTADGGAGDAFPDGFPGSHGADPGDLRESGDVVLEDSVEPSARS